MYFTVTDRCSSAYQYILLYILYFYLQVQVAYQRCEPTRFLHVTVLCTSGPGTLCSSSTSVGGRRDVGGTVHQGYAHHYITTMASLPACTIFSSVNGRVFDVSSMFLVCKVNKCLKFKGTCRDNKLAK